MFYFEHPEAWALLALLAVLAVFRARRNRWRKKALTAIGDAALVQWQIHAPTQERWGVAMPLLAMLFTIAALADPRKRGKEESQTVKGVEVILALDVSNSMLAADVPPNRITLARQLAERLIRKLGGNRIGILVFAGHAYQQVPLTDDVNALLTGLASAEPGAVSAQGTNITEAIGTAIESFKIKAKAHKALVLMSDGEEHEPGAEAAARAAFTDEGIVIHTIGIGSPAGAALTDPTTAAPRLGDDGRPVVSRLDESLLREIAQKANGQYALLQQPEAVAGRIAGAINSMAGTPLRMTRNAGYTSYYPWLVAAAILCLLAGWMLVRRDAATRLSGAVAMLLLIAQPCSAQDQRKAIREGNQRYAEKKYPDAAQRYRQALQQDSTNATARYNLGNALWQKGDVQAAMQAWLKAATGDTAKTIQAHTQYNMGNAAAQQQDWQSAVSRYTKALRHKPGDADAKYNLSYALKKLKEQQQQNQQDEKNKDKDQKNQDQNKQQDQKSQDQNKQQQDQKNQNQPANNQDQQRRQQQNNQGNPQQQSPQNSSQQDGRQPMPSKLSAQQAAAMLNAVQHQERQTRDQLRKTKAPISAGGKKDW